MGSRNNLCRTILSIVSYFAFNCKCRYLISAILLWSLMEQVDLIPPSIKHLQFDRFLKNGNSLLCLTDSLKMIIFNYEQVKTIVTWHYICPSCFILSSRFSIINESHCCNILCDTGCIISCTQRINIHGCISSLSSGLVGSFSSCWWSRRCRAGEIWLTSLYQSQSDSINS